MSIVAVVGDASTTTSIALTTCLAADHAATLVELDRSGGDAAAWLDLPREPGLAALAASRTSGQWPAVTEAIRRSSSGIDALVAPVRAAEGERVVAAVEGSLVPLMAALDDRVFVVDAGRPGASAPSLLVRAAAVVVLLHRQAATSAPAAVAAFERLDESVRQLRTQNANVLVAILGSQPYRPEEVARFLDTDTVGIAVDPWAAAVLAGRSGSARRLQRSPLMASARRLAAAVAEQLAGASARPDATPSAQTGSTAASHELPGAVLR